MMPFAISLQRQLKQHAPKNDFLCTYGVYVCVCVCQWTKMENVTGNSLALKLDISLGKIILYENLNMCPTAKNTLPGCNIFHFIHTFSTVRHRSHHHRSFFSRQIPAVFHTEQATQPNIKINIIFQEVHVRIRLCRNFFFSFFHPFIMRFSLFSFLHDSFKVLVSVFKNHIVQFSASAPTMCLNTCTPNILRWLHCRGMHLMSFSPAFAWNTTQNKKEGRWKKEKFSVLARESFGFSKCIYGKLCHFTRTNYHMIARSIQSLICQLPSAIEYVALTLKPQNPNQNVIVSKKFKKKNK